MIITNTINTDLWIRERTQQIHAVQGDSCTRKITLKLFANRAPWVPDADVSVMIRYHKPDGTGGSYDTLPNGEKAWEIKENIISFILAPQMLSVPGRVSAQVEMLSQNGILASFPLHILVEENVAAEVLRSGDYFSWEQRLEWERYKTLEQAKQSGEFDGPVGATPDLQIGTVSTLGADQMAKASIRGTPENPILDLELPKGADAAVDTTLLIAGYAADAAAVGAALALKAPAGYGLGGEAKKLTGADNLDEVWQSGNYYWDSDIPINAPVFNSYTNGMFSFMRVDGLAEGTFKQTVWSYFPDTAGQCMMRDCTGEWEWVNQPLLPGVEYRTTERYSGKPVYTIVCNFGALPNNTTKTVIVKTTDGNDVSFVQIVNVRCSETSSGGRNVTDNCWITGGAVMRINCSTTYDASGTTMMVTVKYTKG